MPCVYSKNPSLRAHRTAVRASEFVIVIVFPATVCGVFSSLSRGQHVKRHNYVCVALCACVHTYMHAHVLEHAEA